jgi:hypothetical protein
VSKEQRACVRPVPRQGFELNHQFNQETFGFSKELTKSIGGTEMWLPLWAERTELGNVSAHTVNLSIDATHKSYKQGGSLIVWESDTKYEVITIGSIGTGTITLNPWVIGAYTNAVAMPLRVVTMTQELEADRDSFLDSVKSQARFVATATEDLSQEPGTNDYPWWSNRQIVTDPAQISSGVKETFQRELETLDSVSGPIYRGFTHTSGIQTSTLSWSGNTAQDLWDIRIWLHRCKGRWKEFWAPTWNGEITITSSALNGATSIEINAINFSQHYSGVLVFAAVTRDGTFHTFQVASAAAGTSGHEVLTLSYPLLGALDVSQIVTTCRLIRSRFDSDRIEIQHNPGGGCTAAVPIIEVLV